MSEAAPKSERVVSIQDDYEYFPGTVMDAVAALQPEASAGRMQLCWASMLCGITAVGGRSGYPILERVRPVIDGPVLFAPAVDAASC